MRVTGLAYGTPWKPSMTWGPEAPRPSTNRPPDRASKPAAVWARSAGVREKVLRMPLANSTVVVLAAR